MRPYIDLDSPPQCQSSMTLNAAIFLAEIKQQSAGSPGRTELKWRMEETAKMLFKKSRWFNQLDNDTVNKR